MNIDPQDISVKIKILKDTGKTLAQASVTLFGIWTEKGWRIMTSDHLHPILGDYIWIQSPCFRTGNVWKEMVFIDDRKTYEKLQEKIYDAYHLTKIKQGEEQNNTPLEGEESVEKIPF